MYYVGRVIGRVKYYVDLSSKRSFYVQLKETVWGGGLLSISTQDTAAGFKPSTHTTLPDGHIPMGLRLG